MEKETNLQNKGLISADRGTKATLTLTIPRSSIKSYANDLSFPIFGLAIRHRLQQHFKGATGPSPCYDLGSEELYVFTWLSGKATYRR